MKPLENQVALITGSTQGIGLAIAVRLASDGAKVVLNGRHADDEKTRAAILTTESAGGGSAGVHYVAGDLTGVENARRIVCEAITHFGRLDLLVNNAGMEKNAPFEEVTEEDYDRVLDLNLKGVFFTTQAFVRHLRLTARPGKIINISSVHEELAFPNFAAYCASKGGLMMLMRNLAVELGPHGITVNNVAPGAIKTPINRELLADKKKLGVLLEKIPLGRMGLPEDVAAAAAFLASKGADYITGETFVIDGGLLRNYREQ